MNPPKPVSGASAQAQWLNRLRSIAMSQRLLSGPGYRVRTSRSGGQTIEIINTPGGGKSGTTAKRFRIKSVHGDYYTCRTWDGTTEGSTDVLVAKPPEIRQSVEDETIEGIEVTFEYDTRADNADGQRTATATGYADQTEVVIPVYHVNDDSDGYSEIWATEPEGGTGVTVGDEDVTWLDDNRAGRAWCQIETP